MLSYFDREMTVTRVLVEKAIVDTLICKILLHYGEDEDPKFRQNTFNWFRKPFVANNDEEEGKYCVEIMGTTQFKMVIKAVSNGLSFRQVSDVLQIVADETGLGRVGTCHEGRISLYIRTIVAMNYSALSKILSEQWAFAIAFDGSAHQSSPYVDVRIRFYMNGDVHDFHAMMLPLAGPHTGLNIYSRIAGFLDVICPSWKRKLLGTSADGAACTSPFL